MEIPETVPVNVGEAIGALSAILLTIVVEKLASLPRARASSLRVFKALGAEATRLETAVEIAVACAVETGLSTSDVLSTFPKPTIDLEIPETVPVKVGEARFAFKSRAV